MIDPAEFEAFLRNHQDMVFTTAFRLTANHAEAQDIAQETFLKAYERYDALRDQPAVGGWLRTVATNLALNHHTRHRRRWRLFSEMHAHDEDESPGFEATFVAPASPEQETADRRDMRAVLEEAVAALPPDQRAAIVLFHFHETSYQEIAKKLRVSLAKVKTDILRGRATLRRRLAGRLDELDFPTSP